MNGNLPERWGRGYRESIPGRGITPKNLVFAEGRLIQWVCREEGEKLEEYG